jgi:hypothetical protein
MISKFCNMFPEVAKMEYQYNALENTIDKTILRE